MARGKGQGAGRPKGAKNKKTQELIARAEAGGVMPLDVLLYAMRLHYAAGEYDKAAEIAKDAAPYLHNRRAAVVVSGPEGGPVQAEVKHDATDELRQYADAIRALVAGELGSPSVGRVSPNGHAQPVGGAEAP